MATKTKARAKKTKVAKKATVKKTTSKKKALHPQIEELVKRAEAQKREEAKKPRKKRNTKSEKVMPSVLPVQRVTDARALPDYPSLALTKEGQISKEEMRKLSISKRLELWKKLNKGEETDFIAITPPEGLLKYRRYADVLAEGLIQEKKPVKDALYCPYCKDWSVFKKHSYLDSKKCIGCGISDNDFYVKSDNKLWGSVKMR